MSVEALMDLRKRIEEMLVERRAEIEKRLERMDRAIAVVGGRQAKLGRAEAQDLVGLLLRSKVERNSRTS